MKDLNFVDTGVSPEICDFLEQLCAQLHQDGVSANWYKNIEEVPQNSIVLVHDPVVPQDIPENSIVFGQRTLNRRERLIIAEEAGLPIPRWFSPANRSDIVDLFDLWSVPHFVFKADSSYNRKGVKLVGLNNVNQYWGQFNFDGDIMMELIKGHPETYKIDVFYDSVIGNRKLPTKSIFEPKFYKLSGWSSLEEKFPELEEQLITLGKTLPFYGAGLTSVDVMLDSEMKPWVIELNTSSVGREFTWSRYTSTYLKGYHAGLISWLNEVDFEQLQVANTSRFSEIRSGGIRVEN